MTADPKLDAPGTGGIGWDTTTGYQLTAGSADFQNVEIVPEYTRVQSYEAGAKKGMIDYYGNWFYGNNDSFLKT